MGNFLVIYRKPTSNIMLNGENLQSFLLRSISDKDGLTVRVGGRADLLKIWLSDNPVGRVANLGDGEQWNNWKFYTLGNMPCIVK